MAWPAIRRIGDIDEDPDSELLGGDGEAPLNRGCTDLETRSDMLREVMLCELWTKRTPASAYTGAFGGLCWSAALKLFVAVGATGEIQTSPNGIKWTHRTAGSSYTGAFNDVCWSPEQALFVAVGATGEIQTSPDGVTWTHRTAASSYTGAFNAVTWSSALGLFVAAGATQEIQTSPNGMAWTHRVAGTPFSGLFRGVTFAGGYFWAVGATWEIQYSNDGITWLRLLEGQVGTEPQLNRVAGNAQKVMVVGQSGTMLMYTVGGSVSELTSPTASNIWALTWADELELFVLIDITGAVWTTPDGVNWDLRAELLSPPGQPNSLVMAGGRLCTVGSSGTIFSSVRVA